MRDSSTWVLNRLENLAYWDSRDLLWQQRWRQGNAWLPQLFTANPNQSNLWKNLISFELSLSILWTWGIFLPNLFENRDLCSSIVKYNIIMKYCGKNYCFTSKFQGVFCKDFVIPRIVIKSFYLTICMFFNPVYFKYQQA